MASQSVRQLVPLTEPPPSRPMLEDRPCAACGAPLDPLRSEAAIPFEDGVRFFCSGACVQEFRGGKRFRIRRTPPRHTLSLEDEARRLAAIREAKAAEARAAAEDADESLPAGLWIGGGLTLCATVLGLFAQTPSLSAASAVFCSLACLCAMWLGRETLPQVGALSWAMGPLGGIGASIAGYQTASAGHGLWALEGAALAAAALLARAFMDRQAQTSLHAAVAALASSLPTRVHVPVRDAGDPLTIEMQQVSAAGIRTGEEVIAMPGETLAVDGVVQAGEARVLPYPGANATLHRGIGDSVIAGARVIDGALRVMATRVGDNRALARVATFGDGNGPGAAPNTRLAENLRRWGGPAVLLSALLVVLLADAGRLAMPLSAASAVLLMAPLLALRRAAQAPLLAAGAHAGARGIVYQNAAALERAGRVSVVAMAPHRTLTEGRPEVVELHLLSKGSADDIIAEVAAAEKAAGGHAIALAVERFAQVRRVRPREVRRAAYVSGRGVTAITTTNEELVVGNRRFLLDSGISVAVADAEAARAENAGRTPVFVAIGGRVRAVITLEDHLRVGARAAVQRMFDMDLEVVLLTGDQRGPIEKLARALDVEHVKAELLPEERGQAVRSLRDAGSKVAAVGFPDEDDDALAAADVGVVLGGAGGTGAERAAALVSEDVRDAAAALWIAHAASAESLRAIRVASSVFGLVVVAGAAGLMVPGLSAVLALAVDTHGLRVGTRLLRRFALRLPANP